MARTKSTEKKSRNNPGARKLGLTADAANGILLELAHIDALAQMAEQNAGTADGKAISALMLLRERGRKISATMEDAWRR